MLTTSQEAEGELTPPQDVRQGLGAALLPRTSPVELFKVSRAALLSQVSHQPPSPRGMSQLGFLKARSHFLPTCLTSGNLSGSFPEPSGFLHGHVSCLCSPHSQPGHWAPNRCQAEPGRHSCPGLWLPTAEPALPMLGGSVDSNWFSASQTTISGQIP